MTNRNMVKPDQGAPDAAKAGPGELAAPEPNPPPPTPIPAPESDPQLFVTHDPTDSPQHKPMIKQDKTKGLKAE